MNNYRVVTTLTNPPRIVSSIIDKELAIEVAVLMNKLGNRCIVLKDSVCTELCFAICQQGYSEFYELMPTIRETAQWTFEEANELLEACK